MRLRTGSRWVLALVGVATWVLGVSELAEPDLSFHAMGVFLVVVGTTVVTSSLRSGLHVRAGVVEVRNVMRRTRRLDARAIRGVEVVPAPGAANLTVGSVQLAIDLIDGTRVLVPSLARYATLAGEARAGVDADRLRAAVGLPGGPALPDRVDS